MPKKVIIPTKLNAIARETLESNGAYCVVQDESMELLGAAGEHADAHALIVRSEKVGPEVIDAFPGLKVIVRAGAGYNTIDTEYARSKGIDVMNTPGANSNAVAEEVMALMMAHARHLIPADASCRSGKWEKSLFMGTEITGKTLGILGLGHIGQLLVRRASGFDMKDHRLRPHRLVRPGEGARRRDGRGFQGRLRALGLCLAAYPRERSYARDDQCERVRTDEGWGRAD